jgi:hypothetical protein
MTEHVSKSTVIHIRDQSGEPHLQRRGGVEDER